MQRTHTTGRPSVILYSLVCLLVLGLGTALGGAGDTPRKGGTLRIALPGEPSTLDLHWADTSVVGTIGIHYADGLYTLGLDGGVIPMLAEGHTVSDDGLVYTFRLRRGVPFHNGTELAAADVVASLRRWGKLHRLGRKLFTRVASVQALDPYTVQLRLDEPYALVLALLGHPGTCVIYPKAVVDEAGDGLTRTFIGTGPFQLTAYQPGRYVKLVRFEQYKSRSEPPNGYGGGKTAWLNTLLFLPMPDPAARVAAVASGEADFTTRINEPYNLLQDHPDLKVFMEDNVKLTTVLNKKQGLFTNVKLRQAFLAALDVEPILRAFVGHPAFYRLDASLDFKASPWWTDVGRELYNQKDQAKARRLLQEAGYRGEPIRYLTTPEFGLSKVTLAIKSQLEAVGFTVDLQGIESFTLLLQRVDNPDLWDAFTNGFIGAMYDPTTVPMIRCDSPLGGWNCDPDVVRLRHAIATEPQFEKRYRLWQAMQQLFWERALGILYGHVSSLTVMQQRVHRPSDMRCPTCYFPYFWNVWLEK